MATTTGSELRGGPLGAAPTAGTTVTALLASLGTSGPNAGAVLTIALVHLLFNLAGTLLIYPYKPVRRLPLEAARSVAGLAVRRRRWAVFYILILFYVLPAAVTVLDRLLR